MCRAQWAGRCTGQRLPVGGPQLVSHAANTHLNMSRWSPTRSPRQPGANYFSGGVQPGPRLGSFPVLTSSVFISPLPSFLFWGVARASVYFNMTRKTDAGHSCADVQSDKGLMGGQVWPFNLRWVFSRGKMAVMIATHGRNLRGSSNVVLYLDAVIYTAALLYCCETIILSSKRRLLYIAVVFAFLFIRLSQVNIWPFLR